MIREIMLVPLPLADSNALISFLIFQISMFLSVSWLSDMLTEPGWLTCRPRNQTNQQKNERSEEITSKKKKDRERTKKIVLGVTPTSFVFVNTI